MRLKLVSDGSPSGTTLVDAETGRDLQLPIERVVFDLSAAYEGQFVVYLAKGGSDVEIVGDPKLKHEHDWFEVTAHDDERLEYVCRCGAKLSLPREQ